MLCCRIDSFECGMDDPSKRVVSRHCLARSVHAELVVAKAVGYRTPGASGIAQRRGKSRSLSRLEAMIIFVARQLIKRNVRESIG